MINRVVLVGRLTKDPELRKTGNGTSVTSFTIAVNRSFQAQGQERQADFIQCVCWNRVAENTAQYTRKGALVGVEGRIQTRSYQNQQGQTVYVTEVLADSVQFLETKSQSQSAPRTFEPSNDFSPSSFESSAPQATANQYAPANDFSPASFESSAPQAAPNQYAPANSFSPGSFESSAPKAAPSMSMPTGFDIDDDDLPF